MSYFVSSRIDGGRGVLFPLPPKLVERVRRVVSAESYLVHFLAMRALAAVTCLVRLLVLVLMWLDGCNTTSRRGICM